MTNNVLQIIIAAVLGGSGIIGIALYFIRRWLEQKLSASEEVRALRTQNRLLRARLEDELHHAQGRVLFWLHRAIVTGTPNGELEEAFNALQTVEGKIKEHDREIVARNS
ncbi:MAG: hypothetical protein LBK69_06000 [Syntrophomonadaceae bacterium]|jgi:hypothetical protein|nr:hypothetical protein [Syntrophomonadaceae bacterium]